MELSKQENVSRQSSILKLPKQRQPLQCVATNPSSSENSPTVKIKRRVSFAKNKRIREFCNEAEPESIWDDTYEEHDLSSTKSNCSNTNEHPVIISVPCDDKENFPVQLFLQNDQLECKEIHTNHSSREIDKSLNNNTNTLMKSIDKKYMMTPNEENDCISTIFYNDAMDITADTSINIVSSFNQETNSLNDTVPVSHICTQNTSIKITENLPLNLYQNSIQNLSNKKELYINNTSNCSEFNQATSSLLGIGGLNKSINQMESTKQNNNFESCLNKVNSSSSVQMEFTSILPSSTWIKPNSLYKTNEKSIINNKIEFTTDVAYTNNHDNLNTDRVTDLSGSIKNISNKLIETLETVHNKDIQYKPKLKETKVSFENSMETTNMVPIYNMTHQVNVDIEKVLPEVLKNNTSKFNQFIKMPEAVPIYDRNHQFGAGATQVECEETIETSKNISNMSMEITKTFPNYKMNQHSDTDVEKVSHTVLQDQTEMFINKSMEITETVPTSNRYYETNVNSEKVRDGKMQEKSKYYYNKLMKINETVPIYNKNYDNVEREPREVIHEKTKIFLNDSIELSEAIEVHKKIHDTIHDSINKIAKISDVITQNKTKIITDNTTKITEAVPIQKKIDQFKIDGRKILYETKRDNSKIMTTASLETKAIPPQVSANVKILQEKTKNFFNKSMERTKTDPKCNMIHESNIDTEMIIYKTTEEKTKIFYNTSMEMTEVIPNCKITQKPDTNIEMIIDNDTEEKTKIFSNKSMEMTEAVSACKEIYQSNSPIRKTHELKQALIDFDPYQINTDVGNKSNKTAEKNNIFVNNLMELTEVTPVYNRIYKSNNNTNKIRCKSINSRSKPFYDKSLKSTESSSIYNVDHSDANIDQNLQDLLQERISTIYNASMKSTETPSFPLSELSSITKNFANNSIPETFQIHKANRKDILTTLSKESLCDENKKILNKTSKKHLKIMTNKSVDSNSVLSTHDQSILNLKKILHKSEDKKTEALNKPINILKSISTNPITSEVITEISSTEKDTFVINKTSKTLNSDFNLNRQAVLNESEDEKTKIFLNKSMDMTETVAMCKSNFQSIAPIKNFLNKSTENIYNTSADFITDSSYSQSKNKNMDKVQSNITDNDQNISMEITLGLPVFISQSKNENKTEYDDYMFSATSKNIKFASDKSNRLSNTIEISPQLDIDRKNNMSNKDTNYSQPVYDSIKVFHDISMEDTLGPSILSSSTDSMNVAKNLNKDSNHETSNKFSNAEESFHRITSDELNILCASMNLPAQRCSRIETTRDNYISLYNNNANILRDSLKDNEIFQQQSVHKNNLFSERNDSLKNQIKTYKTFEKDNDYGIFCNIKTKESHSIQLEKENAKNVIFTPDFSISNKSSVDNCLITENNINICSTRTNTCCKLLTDPTDRMEIDNRAEIIFKHPKYNQQSCGPIAIYHDDSVEINKNFKSLNKSANRENILSNSVFNIQSSEKVCNSLNNCNNENNCEISSIVFTDEQSINKISIDTVNDIHYEMNLSTIESCPVNDTDQIHENVNVKTLDTIVNKNLRFTDSEKYSNSKIEIYHDILLESVSSSNSLNANKKFKKMNDSSVNKTKITSNKSGIIDSFMEIYPNLNENKNTTISAENSLIRIPSDNTDVLLATMGFKTELSHPLIINDKTMIKVLNKPIPNKTYIIDSSTNLNNSTESNEALIKNLNKYEQNKNTLSNINEFKNNEEENKIKNIEIPVIENNIEMNNIDEDCLDKRNKRSGIKENLFSENQLELEEIEPPSFLCSDSFQDDSIEHISISNKEDSNILLHNLNEKNTNLSISEINHVKIKNSENNKQSRNKLSIELSLKNCTSERANKVKICVNEKKEKPLTTILSLIEDIKKYEKRDDCIWSIRAINQKLIAIDYITKSFVIIIRLNEPEKACIKDIKEIEVISRLSNNSKNILLKIVHNLLYMKLKPSKMLEEYKMYEHILSLLEYISSEVIFAMNFMFDLKRIKTSYLLNIDNERIIFMVSSRKANIILKVSLVIKIISEIGPSDVDVTCILGEIRKNDIMQLIINIKRDYKFLSRYINDIKDYITLMEESTYLNKHQIMDLQ